MSNGILKPILLVRVGRKEFKGKSNKELQASYDKNKAKLIEETGDQYHILMVESKEFHYGLRFKVL